MNKTKIGIFLSLLLLIGLTSCGEQKSNNKLVLNEILIDNQSNFQDDYGLHSAWIEIFNKSFGSADLAACLLKVSSQPGDTVTYFIPKGDILTLVKPRQHALFWADGEPNRGTFHTSFKLNPETANWVGLFDSGKKNGFKALVYMHRYRPDLLARLRTDYVHEQQERYHTQIAHLEEAEAAASGAERTRATKALKKLRDQLDETTAFEEKVHHLADQMIEIDLDDGVKVNYAKFQDVLAKIK